MRYPRRTEAVFSRSGPSTDAGGGGLLYGIAPVQAALEANRRRLERLYLKPQASPRLQKLKALAAARGLAVSEVEGAELARHCGSSAHQGVVLYCGALPLADEKTCLAKARDGQGLWVALDEVQDPHNLGAVLRACAAFGCAGLVLPRRHRAPLSAVASKSSAGHLECFPVYEVANLARFLGHCRKEGLWVAGAAMEGETPLHRQTPLRPLVLVLGNEGRGLRPLVAKQCDVQLAIHTSVPGGLNVASAAAVLLYQLTLPPQHRA